MVNEWNISFAGLASHERGACLVSLRLLRRVAAAKRLKSLPRPSRFLQDVHERAL